METLEFLSNSQVIINCSYTSMPNGSMICVSPETCLKVDGTKVSELVHIENLVEYPNWKLFGPSENPCFTLIFTGLPKDCEYFELDIDLTLYPVTRILRVSEDELEVKTDEENGVGGITISNMERINTDVYNVDILC